jgi:hypothetical protein
MRPGKATLAILCRIPFLCYDRRTAPTEKPNAGLRLSLQPLRSVHRNEADGGGRSPAQVSDLPQESAARLSDRAVFCDLRQGIDPGFGRKGHDGPLATGFAPRRLQLLLRRLDALRQAARPLMGWAVLGPYRHRWTARYMQRLNWRSQPRVHCCKSRGRDGHAIASPRPPQLR